MSIALISCLFCLVNYHRLRQWLLKKKIYVIPHLSGIHKQGHMQYAPTVMDSRFHGNNISYGITY